MLVSTNARGVSTHVTYDELNRPIRRWFNNSNSTSATTNGSLPSGVAVTDEINYFYDSQSLPSGAPSFTRGYSTGGLVAVTYGGGSAGTYRGYDEMGRVVRQYQRTDSTNYLTEATYNLNSSLATETYPAVPGASDRRTITYAPDNAGRLGSWTSSATSYAPAASVSSIGYAPENMLKTETYGNSLIHAVSYNNRHQPIEIKLGTSSNSTSILDLNYSYGTTANNGDVLSVSYAGGGLSYTQGFSYDSLNRLDTASEANGGTTNWTQTNKYDRYGNRQIDYGGGSYNLTFSSTTNRITTSGYSYDSSGNLINDGVHSYAFDAANKIAQVDNVTAYVYDGEAKRVKKLVGENTRFVYGIDGELVAEYDGSSGNLNKEYIASITIEPTAINSHGTQYPTVDHLGSPRVITNSSGSVVSRHDYQPFGEELSTGIGGRTTGMGYGGGSADNNRKKFTLKERDNETGLDYFGARYYGSTQGRFTSADPANITGHHVVNPQRWNLYVYVNNNPLALFDPDGRNPQGKAGRTIDIFLTFDPSERDYTTYGKRKVVDKGPDYDKLIKKGKDAGFNVVVHQASGSDTATATNSLMTAEVFSVVGHGLGSTQNNKFTATDVKLNGGVIGTDGVQQTKANPDGSVTPITPKTDPAPDNATVTALFTCNSADQLPNAFQLFDTNQIIVVNTGGNGGTTTIGTLEQANYDLIDMYIQTNGNVDKSVAAAQAVVNASSIPVNKDGDTIKKAP